MASNTPPSTARPSSAMKLVKDLSLCLLLIGLIYAAKASDPVAMVLLIGMGFVSGVVHLFEKNQP